MIKIRFMQNNDIPAVMELCKIAQYHILEADLKRLFKIQPDGLFVARENDTICGIANAVHYGSELGWIGMILVDPAFHNQGIEAQLVQECVSFLFGKKAECIKLDATDQIQRICLKQQFKIEQPLIGYCCTRPMTYNVQCGQITTSLDWKRISEFDKIAFGGHRLELLKILDKNGYAVQFSEEGSSGFGYGFARVGLHSSYIGPVIASDCIIAQKIVNALLLKVSQHPILIDILPRNDKSTELVNALGFQITRKVTRMYLGNPKTGVNNYVFGAAGSELG